MFIRLAFIALAAMWSSGAHAKGSPPRVELELLALHGSTTSHEISGIARLGKDLVVVSDNEEDHFLFRVEFAESLDDQVKPPFNLIPLLDLSSLSGFDSYKKVMAKSTTVRNKDRRLDLEGVAVCDSEIFLANERVRHILRVSGNFRNLNHVTMDLTSIDHLDAGGGNAGFEGVAADCKAQKLYVGKERDPRILFEFDLSSKKVRELPLEESDRSPAKAINPWTGEGLIDVRSDIADLYFADSYLYILERNTHEIAKYDPKTGTVVARVSIFSTSNGLFDTGEPFGNAEALLLEAERIWVGFDHNGAPLGARWSAKTKITTNGGVLAEFKRPKGF